MKSGCDEGKGGGRVLAYNCVLMLSNGVTASKDSVMPAPKPAMTVPGPEILPFASSRRDL